MTTPNPHPVRKTKQTIHEPALKLDKRDIKIMELSIIEKQEAHIALPVTLPPKVASLIL
jgi:hypothetical protein